MSAKTEPPEFIEWKDARNHREPKWPLMGYAPGEYMGRCILCQGKFHDLDKRAYHCLPCAIDAANARAVDVVEELRATRIENETLRSTIRIVGGGRPRP